MTRDDTAGFGDSDPVSERTEQRRIKRHHDEIAALRTRRRAGAVMSLATAAARVRASYTLETGLWHKKCLVCDEPFDSKRSDKVTCSAKCRKRWSTGATDPSRWLGEDWRPTR